MANSTRNDTQRRPPSELDASPQDWAETAKGKDGPTGESRSSVETPSLWHSSPRSECWTSTSITESGSWGSPFGAPGRPALRLRRPARRGTPPHLRDPCRERKCDSFSLAASFWPIEAPRCA